MSDYVKERLAEIPIEAKPRRPMAEKLVATQRYRPAKLPTDLYFIETQCAQKHIKIGIASNMKDRLSTMQTHCPYPIKLLKLVPGAAEMEKDLHKRFIRDRLTGEWFRSSPELLELIASMEGITSLDPPPKPPIDFEDMSRTWHEFTTRTGRYEGLVLEEDGADL
jgi:hypothetical protein